MNGFFETYCLTRADVIATLSNITRALSQAIFDAAEDGDTETVCKLAQTYTPAQAALLRLMKEEMQEMGNLQEQIEKFKESEDSDHE